MEDIYVDCFYYGFWINKCDLHKYNLSEEYLNNKIKNIYKENSIKNCNNKKKEEENQYYICSTYNKIIEKISQKISNLTTINTTNEDNYSMLYFKYITEPLFSYNCLNTRRFSYMFCLHNKKSMTKK